jgi:uncharacterized membrane protein
MLGTSGLMAHDASHPQHADHPISRNIETIMRIEEESHARRNLLDRLGDGISGFAGSAWFVVSHALWFGGWIAANRWLSQPFDPFPHSFLTFLVSLEAVFLSGFILNTQRHIKRLSDQRAHVNLQIDLLAEAELTKVLQQVTAIATKLGIEQIQHDRETQALASKTDVEQVARAVHERAE